jgi:hypothetical protein
MNTIPAGVRPANPTLAPRVPAGRNSLAATVTRRSIVAAMLSAPAVAALGASLPVLAIDDTPFMAAHRAYVMAKRELDRAGTGRSNSEEERLSEIYSKAITRVDTTPAGNWQEFVLALEVAWQDDGDPFEDLKLKLLADARRLAAEGR